MLNISTQLTKRTIRLLITSLTLALPLAVFGQIAGEGQRYSAGFRAGGSINWASFAIKESKDTFSVRPASGYQFGAFIGFPLKDEWNVLIEGGFSRKGRIMKDLLITNSSSYKFIDASLILRKSFKFQLAPNVPSDWFVGLGPEISYWLRGKGNIRANGPGYPYKIMFTGHPDSASHQPPTELYYNSANRFLFSLVFNVGFKAPLGPGQSITAELRFISGHTNLGAKKNDYPVYSWYDILNYQDTLQMNLKTVSLSIAYSWDFNTIKQRMGKSTNKMKKKKR